MKSVLGVAVLLAWASPHAPASAPRACVGSLPVGTFRITVTRADGGTARPIRLLNRLMPGYKLRYEPVKLPARTENGARVAVALMPADNSDDIVVLDPQPALKPAEWSVPHSASVIAVVFGPTGLDAKKVDKLAERQRDLLPQLADYAEQTAQVETLIETLSAWEDAPTGSQNLEAALSGFSAQYGVSVPKVDPKAPTNQQAAALMRGLLPALSSYDPLAPQRTSVMQQSAGLAATVATMFWGSPVGLASGGAAMLQNMRTMMFPGTELRTAIAQAQGPDSVALCSKPQPAPSRTRLAYLWALRIPDAPAPKVALKNTTWLPAGWKSDVRIAGHRLLPRAYDWKLIPAAGGDPVPIPVTVGTGFESLTLDLSRAKVLPGEYRLAARWDWEDLPVEGTLQVAQFGDLAAARLTPESQDRLVEGRGAVTVQLAGADFQFLEKAWLVKPERRGASTSEVSFVLPKGSRAGPQETVEVDLDLRSLARGKYALRLAQMNGKPQDIAFVVLPPHPRIGTVRANLGETLQVLSLQGSGLERIQGITSDSAEFELGALSTGAKPGSERQVRVKLRPEARRGERYDLTLKVAGLHAPLRIPRALEVAGPRPKLLNVKISLPDEAAIALRDREIPAGSTVSLAMTAQNLDAAPVLEMTCEGQDQKLTLRPGDRSGGARLDLAGEGLLFVSLDPAAIGQSGCVLTAVVATEDAGRSDVYRLGRVTRMPRIEQFTLTDEKAGESLYFGILKGQDLETIEKTGWDARQGVPVNAIPAPVAGEPGKQTLRVILPWPAPAPRAPVYIWLRGESEGRATRAKF
ncbi:MAG: hypothetical protein IT158_18000 [Bryobacterales bacterium]|nr:hypothetical protein [Bryobacterales bacterium]